jgi:hypothetical protein
VEGADWERVVQLHPFEAHVAGASTKVQEVERGLGVVVVVHRSRLDPRIVRVASVLHVPLGG